MGGTRVTIDYDANGWPTAVTHHPGLGDDVLLATEHGTSSTTGQTPEISGWGDGTAGAAQAGRAGSQALRTEFIRDVAGRLLQKRTANHHYHYRYDTVDQLLSATKLQVQPDGSLPLRRLWARLLCSLLLQRPGSLPLVHQPVRMDGKDW